MGQAYLDLVFGDWWTDETLIANANGEVSTRGFLGDYEVIVSGGDYEQRFNATVEGGGSVETLAFVAPQASTASRTATVTEANAKVVFICS